MINPIKYIKDWYDIVKSNIELFGFWTGIRFSITLPEWYYTVRSWFFPYNVIKIKTLPKTWCDRVDVLLHGAFQVLVDFCEKELDVLKKRDEIFSDPFKFLAKMAETKELDDLLYFGFHIFDLEKEREYYVQHGYDAEMIEMEMESLRKQNEITKEIARLYGWWVNARPYRESQDPLNAVDSPTYKSIPTDETEKYFTLESEFKDEKHKALWEKAVKESDEWEEACHKEDEEMLIRLIKVRRCLWT